MLLNLQLLALENVQKFARQKCLLPKQKFSGEFIPGAWVKCQISNGSNLVCQIFPRIFKDSTLSIAYMDNIQNIEKFQNNLQLAKIELLQASPHSTNDIALDFYITEACLAESDKNHLTLGFLRNAVHKLLQSVTLAHGCLLQLPELLELGIAQLLVCESSSSAHKNSYFTINNHTTITVSNVHLVSDKNVHISESNVLFDFEFGQVNQNLHDLLLISKMNCQNHNGLVVKSNALIIGPTGCGKSELIRKFVMDNQCNCFNVSSDSVMGHYPGVAESKLRSIFQSARVFAENFHPKNSTIVLIEDLHLICPANKKSLETSNESQRICSQLVSLIDKSPPNITCIATTSKPEEINDMLHRPGRFDNKIFIQKFQALERKQIFSAFFKNSFLCKKMNINLTPQIMEMVEKYTHGYVIADFKLFLRNLEQIVLSSGYEKFSQLLLECFKKTRPLTMLFTDVLVSKIDHSFKNIGGMQNLKRILEISVLAGLNHQKAFQRFGLHLPKGILFYGPPGCAKTTFAKALATEANLNFIATSAAEIYSPFVGCAEKFIIKIFDSARRNSPCLIFLDEIDSLVGKRSTDSKGSADVQLRILSTLLTEIDGFNMTVNKKTGTSSSNIILVVAATNRPDMIDDALLRPGRFDKLIHVPVPDRDSRLAILQLYSKRMPFSSDLDLKAMADRTHNFSGADVCNLCNEAAIQAFQRNNDASEILLEDFEKTLITHKSSLTDKQMQYYYEFEKFTKNRFV